VLGYFSNALNEQEKKWTSPMPEKRNYTASYIFTAYTVCRTLCPNADTWNDKSQHQNQGEGFPPQPVHRGSPVKRATPSRLTAFIYIFILYHRITSYISFQPHSNYQLWHCGISDMKAYNFRPIFCHVIRTLVTLSHQVYAIARDPLTPLK
jgi:hypothetical protein